ncbi:MULTISPECIES: MerR family transcriptional regulator [Polaribacter]|uniref:MerR family transcriptional regulator n=1 Tax=Polaribacter sejongensis TaxID=985043 RepID=A0AAJ1QVK0_9FLAO|nr:MULTISPECIES: MerR family transcriptional regulator [Polaribacter]AUC22875.1 MerR family transcriptional regulator [Polaribacter sejongensis]MDN3618847.1 MerR family transcriptional regulator [Polaribacter undariae]UWD32937.1 MerR family transcriptional regulator [Polaribacter undariae]
MNNIKLDFTIKDLENISGIKAHTIRIWEKRYNLLEPKRSETNIRFYSNEDLQKLLNIVLLNNNDIKISKISKMSDEELILQTRALAFETSLNDESINALKLSMFQFDKRLFNNVYEKLLEEKTFQEIFQEVFIPFLNDVGLLWQTDTLKPAHEHFISNLIVQKILINTEKLQFDISESSKTYVLFLPENEIHEIGLLYLNYELVLRGAHTIYLGQSLPLNNLDYFLESDNEICFITSLTIKPYDDKIEDYFKEIDVMIRNSGKTFVAIGQKVNQVKHLDLSPQIHLHNTITDLLKVI